MRFALDFMCLTDDEYCRTKPGQVWSGQFVPAPSQYVSPSWVAVQSVGFMPIHAWYPQFSCGTFSAILTLYISYFCTLIALSSTYTCIHKYLTLPKITLYESCWHSGSCNSWYFLILCFKPYCFSFYDSMSERYWSNMQSHSFWTMGTPIFELIVLISS